MSDRPIRQVVQQLRQLVLAHEADWTDAQLLQRFLGQRDEAAFAALVSRHGPMVLGVCRRVLGNAADADDAFQATFLVLVRKAASLRPLTPVGNWLYGVAYRTALKARAKAARRRAKEQVVKERQPLAALPDTAWHEVQPLLDQELSRLPEKYRVPVVLCDLEGKTRKEAAGQLRLPEGTVSSRLATARRMLAHRLARRGVTLSGGALATTLAESAAVAVPPALADATVQAAALSLGSQTVGAISASILVLTEEVMKSFLLSRLKVVAVVVLLAGLLGTGASNVLHPAAAGQAETNRGGEAPIAQVKKTGKKEKDSEGAGGGLGRIVSVSFNDVRLTDALGELRDLSGVNLVVDPVAGKGIAFDARIQVQLDRVPFKTALKHVLRQVKLGYTVEDGILIISPADVAQNKLVRKVYPAADLADLEDQIVVGHGGGIPAGMGAVGGLGGNVGGPILQPAPGRQLIQLLATTVEPNSWHEQGGPGTIAYHAKGGCLVVSQCSEVQDQIQILLEELRAAKKLQEESGLLNNAGGGAG
jgi:RNA polymerase sigma factor (sigma-70 family)